MRPRSWTAPLWVASLAAGACSGAPAAAPIRVAAASDLSAVFGDLAAAFERAEHARVEVTFGSSGLLARQLAEGAPYDAFFAASEALADRAASSGACDPRSKRRYARGRLVLWSRDDAPRADGLPALADPRFARIAIANPEHAPYGLAARQALEHAGVWAAVAGRVVRADNVRQALELARSGNAEVALVARSLVGGVRGGRALLLPEALHAPILQVAVACLQGPDPDGGRRFLRFVTGPEGRALLAHGGLEVP